MRSEKQAQASRANGAKSRGPTSPSGKATSAANSTRHGLLSRTVVLAEEVESRFCELLDAYIDEFQPVTASEMSLVENLAISRWKLFRVWGVQKSSVDRDMAVQKSKWAAPAAYRAGFALQGTLDSAISPATLDRYEKLYSNQFNRALQRLDQIKKRKFRPVSPYEPALPCGETWKDTHPDAEERPSDQPQTAEPMEAAEHQPNSTSPMPNEPEN